MAVSTMTGGMVDPAQQQGWVNRSLMYSAPRSPLANYLGGQQQQPAATQQAQQPAASQPSPLVDYFAPYRGQANFFSGHGANYNPAQQQATAPSEQGQGSAAQQQQQSGGRQPTVPAGVDRSDWLSFGSWLEQAHPGLEQARQAERSRIYNAYGRPAAFMPAMNNVERAMQDWEYQVAKNYGYAGARPNFMPGITATH
jgi:hypothetical protein